MMKRRNRLFPLSALVLCLGIANASPVLDQSQLVYNGGLSARTFPDSPVWQSFTGSITGSLTEIDLGFFAGADGPVFFPWSGHGTLQILAGNGTEGNILQSLAVNAMTLPQSTLTWNNWAVDVPVTAGQQYTFNFIPGIGIPDPYGVAIGTIGSAEVGPYSGGDLMGDTRFDSVFRTYVDPNCDPANAPEPSTLVLISSASAFMLFRVARRRFCHDSAA